MGSTGQGMGRVTDPARGARVLVMEPDPAKLERLADVLRRAGCRVAALSRPNAALALTRAFRPDAAIIGVCGPDLAGLRVGRRIDRRFQGSVPVLYLGDASNSEARRFSFAQGKALAILPREVDREELLAGLRATLAFRNAVEARVRSELETRPKSMHDDATGLFTRAFLMELVASEARRGERYGGCFSVAIVELDEFMALRERFGEGVCERLTAYAALVLKQTLRDSDVVARVGNYHLGVLLPGMPAETAGALLDRVARRFASASFELHGERVTPTVSLGMASFPDVVGPAEQMFVRAIQELDRARGERRGSRVAARQNMRAAKIG
jgi:two-component system, cell cycle response regulator